MEELWLFITCILLIGVGLGAHFMAAASEWHHLNTCKKTREGMARMIKND